MSTIVYFILLVAIEVFTLMLITIILQYSHLLLLTIPLLTVLRTLVITTNDCNKRFCSDILNVFIGDHNFGGNRYYSLHCKGTVNLPPRILIFSSNFSNNQDSAVKAESCDIIFAK